MQSYLSSWETGFLTLEIGYFLLCIAAQFRGITVPVIISALINLGFLFLLQQAFVLGDLFPEKQHLAIFGSMFFFLIGLAITSMDDYGHKAKNRVATKLPFIGIALGYYVPAPYYYYVMLGSVAHLTYYLFSHRDRYRLYFRAYFFMLVMGGLALLSHFVYPLQFLRPIFLFFVIIYLNQLLNLMMVKSFLRGNLTVKNEEVKI